MPRRFPVATTVDRAIVDRLDVLRARLSDRIDGIRISRSNMLRAVIEAGLDAIETDENGRRPQLAAPDSER